MLLFGTCGFRSPLLAYWGGIWSNTCISLSMTRGEADWRRCKIWWNRRWEAEWERNTEWEIKKGWSEEEYEVDSLRWGPKEFKVLAADEFTSCFNSGWTRQGKKTVPASLQQCSWRGQTSPQLEKTNLTHLWIPFNVYHLQKEKYRRGAIKKKKRKEKDSGAKRKTVLLRHLTQWTFQRSHSKVVFMCWERTTRHKTLLEEQQMKRKYGD